MKYSSIKYLLFALVLSIILSQGMTQNTTLAQSPAPDSTNRQDTIAPNPSPSPPPRPPVRLLNNPQQIQLQLVNCTWGLDCFLARLFLPASSRLNQIDLQLDNGSPDPAIILSSALNIEGTLTQYPLPAGALSLPTGEITIPPRSIMDVPITIDRSAMAPENYIGAIYLTQAGQTNRLAFPINMSVRCGPLLPLVVLLIGVVLGRLFKYMQAEGGPQSELRKKVYQLEADLKELHPGDRQILRPMLQGTRKLVYRRQLEAADSQVSLIQSRQAVLVQLRTIEDQLYEKQARGDLISEQLFDQIQDARDLIAQQQDADARDVLKDILLTATARGRGGAGDFDDDTQDLEAGLRGATLTFEKNSRHVVPESALTVPRTRFEKIQQVFVTLAGLSDKVRTEATFWFVRPLLYLVLISGLTLVGLSTLYIEKGETFGARPMSDYLALLLWGLSADVASRSLSNLQGQDE